MARGRGQGDGRYERLGLGRRSRRGRRRRGRAGEGEAEQPEQMRSGQRALPYPRRVGRRAPLWLLLPLAVAATSLRAAEPGRIPPLLGAETSVLVEPDDTLLDIAWRHRVGFEAVERLNPDVDPWIPPLGTVVRLPTRFVQPAVEPRGLVINVPEMRLYDFTGSAGPQVFAAAVGDAEDPTPIGVFRIGTKRIDPVWNVPESIRREKPHLPERVPPGPDNPLGDRWMTIGTSSYGIHGTNLRWSIGHAATHGCVRLYADEMRRLYDRIRPGTPLTIVYQPVKWGRYGATLYVEVHPDLYGRTPDLLGEALRLLGERGILAHVRTRALERAVREARGIPVEVGRLVAAAHAPTSGSPSGR